MSDPTHTLSLLSTAIELEKQGQRRFEQLARDCRDPLARRMFASLADDESVHVDQIRALWRRLEGGAPWSDPPPPGGRATRALEALIDGPLPAADAPCDAGDVEAIDVGIELEERSIAFYRDALERADEGRQRRFLEALIDEERDHREALIGLRRFLVDPSAWRSERRGSLDDVSDERQAPPGDDDPR